MATLKLAWQGELGVKGKSLGVLSTIAIRGAIYWGIGLMVAGVPVYVVMKKLRRDDAATTSQNAESG